MAKASKTKATGNNVVPLAKNTAVAAGAPSYLAGFKGQLGTENIGTEDVAIPRLKLAQALTPQVKDGDMKDGAIFLNVTGEVFAEPSTDLKIVPLVYAKEYILWRPRKDGGGILARAKPVTVGGKTRYEWDKPNTTFDVKVEGKTAVKWTTKKYIDEDGLGEWGSEIPGNKDSGIAATAHFNYVVALPEHGNMVAALSLSRSQAKRAKDFNAMLKMGTAPMFARVFLVKSVDDTNTSKEEFKNFLVTPNGFVPDEVDFNRYREISEGFRAKGFTVDQSDEDADNEATGAL